MGSVNRSEKYAAQQQKIEKKRIYCRNRYSCHCGAELFFYGFGVVPEYDYCPGADRYLAQIDILREPGTVTDENLLWSSGQISSFCGDITLDPDVSSIYLRVSSVSVSTLPFQYELELLSESGSLFSVPSAGEKYVLTPGIAAAETVTVPSGQTLRLQFRTAFQNSTIVTASASKELTAYHAPGTVIYLTEDIAAEQALVFDKSYPNINLNGYTLEAEAITVSAPEGICGTMCIENGFLFIGGRVYTGQERIPTSGGGFVAVTLRDLIQEKAVRNIYPPVLTPEATAAAASELPRVTETPEPSPSPAESSASPTEAAPAPELTPVPSAEEVPLTPNESATPEITALSPNTENPKA